MAILLSTAVLCRTFLPGINTIFAMVMQFSFSNPFQIAWWRHQVETFSALLAICAGNSLITVEFPVQRPVTLCFEVFFALRLYKRLSKQSWGWWFETASRSLWRENPTNHEPRACLLRRTLIRVKLVLWITSPPVQGHISQPWALPSKARWDQCN